MSKKQIALALFLLGIAGMIGGWQDCRQNDRLDRIEQSAPVSQDIGGPPAVPVWCSIIRHQQDWQYEFLCIPV